MRWTIAAVLVGVCGLAAAADPPTKAEIAKATKPTVAIVHSELQSASAVCLSGGGYFLTVATVVPNLDRARSVTVVLNGGEKDERVMPGRVVRFDPVLGLALVKADADGPFAAVALGDETKVGELDEVIAFAATPLLVPPVYMAAPRPLKAPVLKYGGVVVSKLKVESLQREKGSLARILLERHDVAPGGPVMDLTGKMIGIVGADTKFRGANPIVPANVLRTFLARPEVSLVAADADPAKKHDPATVRVSVFALPDAPDDETVELAVRSDGRERRLEMKRTPKGYEAVVAPFEKADGPPKIRVEVEYPDGTVRGGMADRTFTVGGKEYALSKVAGVRFGKGAGVQLPDGSSVVGEVKGLDELILTLGDKPLSLPTAGARELVVVPRTEPEGGFRFSAVVRRGGKEIGRTEALQFLKGGEPWGFDGLRLGRFTKPPESDRPVTHVVFAGTPGERRTNGERLTYDPTQIKATAETGTGGTQITLALRRVFFNRRSDREDVDMATLAIGGHTGEPLEARLYPKVVAENNRHWIPDTGGAALVLLGERPELSGRFAVWEVEIAPDKKTVTKLAFDAVLFLDKQDAPVLISVRFNSKFK